MDLERLRMFIAIVEEGSLTGASKRLEVTQPAVSRNLKLLEEELQVALFERVGRGLEITQAGKVLLPRAYEMLQRMERISQDVKYASTQQLDLVRVGAVPTLMMSAVPRAVASFKDDYALLDWQWSSASSARLLALLNEGILDVAVVTGEAAPPVENVHYVTHYQHVTVAHRALLAQGEVMSSVPDVGMASGDGVESCATVKSLVMQGFGKAVLPTSVFSGAEREELVCLPALDAHEESVYLVVSSGFIGDASSGFVEKILQGLRQVLVMV